MKFFFKGKDGGPESMVTGYWLIESKKFFSIALMRFDKGSREAYHTHAFYAISWVMWGQLSEMTLPNHHCNRYPASVLPIWTPRNRFHRVWGDCDVNWVLTFRGPWVDKWKEWIPKGDRNITLTHGRKEINETSI